MKQNSRLAAALRIFSGESRPPPTKAKGASTGPGQPRTNWARAEEKEHVAVTGRAADFWTRYAEDFQLVRGLGLNAFRLGIEWSRVQPSLDPGKRTAAGVRFRGAGALRGDADRLPRSRGSSRC